MEIPYRIIIGERLSASKKSLIQNSVKNIFKTIDKVANPFNPKSELTLLNNNKITKLCPTLSKLINLSIKMSKLTDNAFDPTVGIYNGDSYASKPRKATTNNFSIIENTIVKSANTQIDLCGIAKGFTVDEISKFLLSQGYHNFLVEWGGEIMAHGHHPQKSSWDVQILGIKKPYKLRNSAIASSGGYYTKENIAKKNWSHVVNSRTKKNIALDSNILGVSCIAKDCASADAIATAIYSDNIKADGLIEKLKKENPDIQIFVIKSPY